jgi:hypothetical protein
MVFGPVRRPLAPNVHVTTSALMAGPAARHYKPTKSEIFSMIGVPPGGFVPKGLDAFKIDGLGSGLMTVGRGVKKLGNGKFQRTVQFLVTADQFKETASTGALKSATLVLVKPNNGGTVEVPMAMAKDQGRGWNRIATTVNQDDLNKLRGNADSLEFVVKLTFKKPLLVGGKPKMVEQEMWVNQQNANTATNKHRNFGLHKDQMKTR